MKPLGPNVALAIDGTGLHGVIAAKALAVVEEAEQLDFSQVTGLAVGISMSSIIAAGISLGFTAARMHSLYYEFAESVFPKTLRSRLALMTGSRYSHKPLIEALKAIFGEAKMGDVWNATPPRDLVIVVHDLVENRARFVKSWSVQYQDWPIWSALVASATTPTYFPIYGEGFVDASFGGYSTAAFIAAYEVLYCLPGWVPEETTLISIGTSTPLTGLLAWDVSALSFRKWTRKALDAVSADMSLLQLDLAQEFLKEGDFRRFEVELVTPIPIDDTDSIVVLTEYGEKLGQKILHDHWEAI